MHGLKGEEMCTFVDGVANSVSDETIGRTITPQECGNLVLKTKPLANGATWDKNTDECYAEFSASNIDHDVLGSLQTCIFEGGYMLK